MSWAHVHAGSTPATRTNFISCLGRCPRNAVCGGHFDEPFASQFTECTSFGFIRTIEQPLYWLQPRMPRRRSRVGTSAGNGRSKRAELRILLADLRLSDPLINLASSTFAPGPKSMKNSAVEEDTPGPSLVVRRLLSSWPPAATMRSVCLVSPRCWSRDWSPASDWHPLTRPRPVDTCEPQVPSCDALRKPGRGDLLSSCSARVSRRLSDIFRPYRDLPSGRAPSPECPRNLQD